MPPLSKKLVLALGAVADIAYNGGSQPVQSKAITGRHGIPQRYLEQVLQQLVRAGVLKGVRGPKGGYRLARERRRISVGDIARVVGTLEKNEDLADTLSHSEIGHKVLDPLCRELAEEVMQRLDSITIEELCRRARAREIERAVPDRLDFTI